MNDFVVFGTPPSSGHCKNCSWNTVRGYKAKYIKLQKFHDKTLDEPKTRL